MGRFQRFSLDNSMVKKLYTRDDSDDSPRSIKAWDAEESHISCLSRQDKDNVYCDSYGVSHKNKIIFKLSNSDSLLSTDLSMNKAVSLDKNGIRNDTHKTDYNKTREGIADWSTIAHNPMGHVGNMEYNSYLNECVPHYASNNLNEMVSKRSMREKMLPTEIRVKRRRAANARERKRVNKITDAFERLREHVPNLIKDRKLSKFETLQMAMALAGNRPRSSRSHRFDALAEIYNIQSFAPFGDLTFFL